jgi:hypothetical protein
MLDSITPGNLPPGADAYAGYADGRFANLTALRARFPGKRILGIAVFAGTDAECADCETGDMAPAQIPGWVKRQLARGVHRPVVYASISVMPAVLAALTGAGITRSEVRLWSAHYGAGKHICTGMDGTQFTDTAPGTGSSLVDESLLSGDFFQAQEADMPLTHADAATILNADGIIANPNGNPANPFWTSAEILEDTNQRIRALQVSLAALVGQDDPAALAKAILAGLSASAIAAAVAAAVGPEVAQEVVAALAAQLGK